MVELVREPKMVMMETFLIAISQTDSRYSSRCWTYILFSSRGDVISCGDRRQRPFKCCLCAKVTHRGRFTAEVMYMWRRRLCMGR